MSRKTEVIVGFACLWLIAYLAPAVLRADREALAFSGVCAAAALVFALATPSRPQK